MRKRRGKFPVILSGSVLLGGLTGWCSGASAQEMVMQRLNSSPRHQEWVAVKAGPRQVQAFVVYPERKDKAVGVLLIHENRGLSDWVRSVADQLAEHGYIALAPDLLSGMGPKGGKTSDFPDDNAARDAIYKLTPEQVTGDLQACADYLKKLPAANGKIVVAGFCWGGAQSFRFATARADLAAAFVFYGTPPGGKEELAKITCPVYGFYGGEDARVNATIPETEKLMKALGKTYQPVIYDGAGHAFMRRGESAKAPDPNTSAMEQAWKRWLALLRTI